MNLDVVICPVFPYPAPKTEHVKTLDWNTTYTIPFNILDLPTGTIPITRHSEADIEAPYPPKETPRTAWGGVDPIFKTINASNSTSSLGLPIGVQIVGLKWNEEKVLAVMKRLERLNKEFRRTLKIRNALPSVDSCLLLLSKVSFDIEQGCYDRKLAYFDDCQKLPLAKNITNLAA